MEKKSLVGQFVKFQYPSREKGLGRMGYGRVTSVEKEVANIRGTEQTTRERPSYHYPLSEIMVCTHEEVYKIGQGKL